ncbi:MAG: helix-turn-helix domain-containing protein [Mogibacterium sp.]|nr:helix-turn-helix domain-containing protein [Mogibacterium sp.]
MGKKSVKSNKNIYFESREAAGLTRAQASEELGFISESRLEKLENEKTPLRPEEVLAMSRAYNKPELCNYYCSHDCPIGQEYVPEVRMRDLSQIVLETLASLNAVEKEKNKLIEITADGAISEDELRDFARIKEELDRISLAADSLQLWLDNTIAAGKIDKEKLDALGGKR